MDTPTLNGRPQRKTLGCQLDRLDRILEALEDGLTSTVAQVVREAVAVAVQQAIQAVILEVMARPELLQHLSGLNAPTPAGVIHEPAVAARVKTLWAGLRRKVSRVWDVLRARLSHLGTRVRAKLPRVGERVREAGRTAWKQRRVVAVSAGVGLALGVAGHAAGPLVASLALGLCGAALSLAALVLSPVVKLWRSLRAQQC